MISTFYKAASFLCVLMLPISGMAAEDAHYGPLTQLRWIRGTIQRGQGVASGRTPLPGLRYGTIETQKPFFSAAGIAVDEYYNGTINVNISPRRWAPSRPDHRIENLRWHPAFDPETFSLFNCAVRLGDQTVEGFIYHPHPGPEPKAFHGPGVLEIWAKPLVGVANGRTISIGVRTGSVGFYED